jgi:uncharacterized protein
MAKIRSLMQSEQPQSINPLRLAKNKEQIKGSLSFDSLTRLEDILLDNHGQVQYSLSFDFDGSGICLIESYIDTAVLLQWQRCLKSVIIEIQKSSVFGVYKDSDEFKKLEDNYEPCQLDEEFILVEKLVEDELLLAIPLIPLHIDKKCIGEDALKALNVNNKMNFFSALAILKNSKV